MQTKQMTGRGRRAASLVAAASAVVATFGFTGLSSSADAVGVCPGAALPVSYTPPADAGLNIWEFEGKISALDPTARTITVNGATFEVPADQLVKTQGLDQTAGNLPLGDLVDPAKGTPVVGGPTSATVIATGSSVYNTDAVTGQVCLSFVANSVYVEWAENVLVGALTGVDPAGAYIEVAGAKVELNTDARFPAGATDATGEPLTLADFAGHEGALMEVDGYYSTERAALQATLVFTDEIIKPPANNVDVVSIGRVTYKNPELRVNGLVSPAGTGKSVTIYRGGLTAAGTCDASVAPIGTAAVSALDGSYDFRNRNVRTNPQTICVQSSGGGARSSAVN